MPGRSYDPIAIDWRPYETPHLQCREASHVRHSIASGRDIVLANAKSPLGVTTPVNDTVVGIIRVRERRMLASMVAQ